MDIIEEAKKAATLKAEADAAAQKAANHEAWTKRSMHCIAWFRENLGFTVEPYGTDYHGVLCRTEDGLHFAWREDAQRLGGSNYRKYPDGPAAVLMQRRTYFLLKGVEGHVKEGTPNARRVTQLYSLSDGMNNNRLFYDLAGLGASLKQAEEASEKYGYDLTWLDDD